MDHQLLLWKASLSILGSWICAKLDFLFPMASILGICMLLDIVSAMVAAVYIGEKLCSQTCRKGIVRKVGLLCLLTVGYTVDWVLDTAAANLSVTPPIAVSFGVLVGCWLVLNELISIMENVGKTGVYIPFLSKIVHVLQKSVEQAGDGTGGKSHEPKTDSPDK